jgi:hypothetical protein
VPQVHPSAAELEVITRDAFARFGLPEIPEGKWKLIDLTGQRPS